MDFSESAIREAEGLGYSRAREIIARARARVNAKLDEYQLRGLPWDADMVAEDVAELTENHPIFKPDATEDNIGFYILCEREFYRHVVRDLIASRKEHAR